MRVLYVTLDVFGGTKKGGGERYVTELARAARARGLVVDVAVVRSIRDFSELIDLDVPPIPISFRRFFGLVRRCDVVHVHQLNTPGFDYALLLAKWLRKPVVLTDHGGGAFTPGRLLGRVRLPLINGAGFVSAWSRQDVDPRGILKHNIVIFGGGDHLPEAGPLDRRRHFGFVGRLLPHKGLHIALSALPDNASLIIAGQPRDPVYFDELRRLSQGKDVTFLEDPTDAVVSSILKSINYLLVPSVNSYGTNLYARPELLGLVALEALAAGTRVIGSDVGGLGEVLRAARQTVLTPGDAELWREHLATAIDTPTSLPDRTEFTWDATAQRCEKLYAMLPGKARGEHG